MKFLLNTASRSNRIGCAYPSPLERTVKDCPPEKRAELLAVARAELAKAEARIAELDDENRRNRYRRGTRSGGNWAARYNRASHKQQQLREAVQRLEAAK